MIKETEMARRRRRRGYQFTETINSKNNLVSMLMILLSITSFLIGVFHAYKKGGHAGGSSGLMGLGAIGLAGLAIYFGIKSLKYKERRYGLSWMGIVLGALIVLFMCGLVIWALLTM